MSGVYIDSPGFIPSSAGPARSRPKRERLVASQIWRQDVVGSTIPCTLRTLRAAGHRRRDARSGCRTPARPQARPCPLEHVQRSDHLHRASIRTTALMPRINWTSWSSPSTWQRACRRCSRSSFPPAPLRMRGAGRRGSNASVSGRDRRTASSGSSPPSLRPSKCDDATIGNGHSAGTLLASSVSAERMLAVSDISAADCRMLSRRAAGFSTLKTM